jgi:hypothetical protein
LEDLHQAAAVYWVAVSVTSENTGGNRRIIFTLPASVEQTGLSSIRRDTLRVDSPLDYRSKARLVIPHCPAIRGTPTDTPPNWFGIVLPLLFGGFEQRVPLPNAIQMEQSARTIAAPPERVWTHLLTSTQIEPNEIGSAWMYRIGVPLPLSAVTELRGEEFVRHIAIGKTIRFDQVTAAWQPGRRVRWACRFEKDSFREGALDDHVRIGGSYFDVIDTEYTISDTPGGTPLHVQMRYRVSTHFNWYVRPIAKFLVHNFEETALAFYARRVERSEPIASPQTSP